VKKHLRWVDALRERIEGGATRGANLFHSFEEFGIEVGNEVDFANPDGIESIFSRVTGQQASDIMGRLGVDGPADLYFLNPNGIVFGPNAQLDVQGSFVATSADAIQFGNSESFSTIEQSVPSQLLTIAPSAFLFDRIRAGTIENNSLANAISLSSDTSVALGLQVPIGKSLLLLGGDVILNSGRISAIDGEVDLGGVSGKGTVGLDINSDDLSLKGTSKN
jgi:filamentous hemagglutinin family protein